MCVAAHLPQVEGTFGVLSASFYVTRSVNTTVEAECFREMHTQPLHQVVVRVFHFSGTGNFGKP